MRNTIKYAIFLVGALSLLTLNVLALSDPSEDSTKTENNSEKPISIGICIDFIPYNHEELRDYSDTIIIGTVRETLPPRWNTIDGKQPDKPVTELNSSDIIYTDINISVDEYLKTPLTSKELIVRVVGGKIGNISMTTDAEPSFNTSEKVLLYLSKDSSPNTKDIGPEHFIVTDFHRGKYTVTDDERAMTPDEITTLDELRSTINQTDDKANDTEISNDTGILNDTEILNDTGISKDAEKASKQEQNSSSTPESKSIPFINSFWALAAVIGATVYWRKIK
jgi:hypothetical protein